MNRGPPLSRLRRPIAGALAPTLVLVAGCQTWGPTWSEVTGARYTAAAVDRRPTFLVQVGDKSVGAIDPFRVAPGRYDIILQLEPDGVRGSTKTMNLVVEPCRRYYINAQFQVRTGPAWFPVIDYVAPIAGCRTPGG